MFENAAALALVALSGTMTPGPNNVMLTASGSTFGFRRSLPHILGVVLGFPVMVAAIGLGLGEVFTRYPSLHLVLKYAGAAYLLYLAWRIARAGGAADGEANARPLSFLEAAVFQWVNVKGWIMAATTIPAFTTVGGNYYAELAMIVGVYLAASIPSTLTWCAFGVAIRRLITSPRTARTVNLVLASTLAGAVLLMIL